MKWEAIIHPPYKTTSFQSAGASISHLTLHLALSMFNLVMSPAVNHNIYLLFFPGDSSSVWNILILFFSACFGQAPLQPRDIWKWQQWQTACLSSVWRTSGRSWLQFFTGRPGPSKSADHLKSQTTYKWEMLWMENKNGINEVFCFVSLSIWIVTFPSQGEAVRLARQLPSNLFREDVEETLLRMEQQLGENSRTCIHGRPFLQHLSDLPSTDQEAKALLKPLEL